MARKDVIRGPAQSLDELNQTHPEFVQMAIQKMSLWDKSEYLVAIFARALIEAHAMGAAGKKPKKRSVEEGLSLEEELTATSKPKSPPRVSRSKVTPSSPISTMRVRRSRP